jgi:predicted PurR-regulated permease PerM
MRIRQEDNFVSKVWTAVGIITFSLITLLVLQATFSVFLLIFAGILIAVFFKGLSGVIERRTHWNGKVCDAISILGTLILIAGFFWLIGSRIQTQVAELSDTLPKTIEKARNQLEGNKLGDKIIEEITSQTSAKKLENFAKGFFKSTFGVFGDLYVVLFIGVFLTVSPEKYIAGVIKLIPSKGQKKAKLIFTTLGLQLRNWLKGTLLSMSVVFVFTAIGLAIMGIPLWLVLALLAGLLSFIPNFGPILALIPAVLVGLMDGPETALWVVGLYLLIQFVESNFITTIIQQKMINLPPALIISAQMILGALTGSWGLILSTPLTAIIIVLIKSLYIEEPENTV